MNPVHLLDGIHTLDGFKIGCKSGVLGRVLNEAKRTKKNCAFFLHSFGRREFDAWFGTKNFQNFVLL